MAGISEDAKKKILSMQSASEMPIEERRKHYNALNRRVKQGGLKDGLSQKYYACLGNHKERFKLLKAFLLDSDMRLGCNAWFPFP